MSFTFKKIILVYHLFEPPCSDTAIAQLCHLPTWKSEHGFLYFILHSLDKFYILNSITIFSCSFARFLAIFFPLFYHKFFTLKRVFYYILLTNLFGILLILSISIPLRFILFPDLVYGSEVMWKFDFSTISLILSSPREWLNFEKNWLNKQQIPGILQICVQFFLFIISAIFPLLFTVKLMHVLRKKRSEKAVFSNLSVSIAYLLQSLVLLFISFFIIMGFAFDISVLANVRPRLDFMLDVAERLIKEKPAALLPFATVDISKAQPGEILKNADSKLIELLGNSTYLVEIPSFINTFGKYLFSNQPNQLSSRVLWVLYQFRFLFDHLLILLTLKTYRLVFINLAKNFMRLFKRVYSNNDTVIFLNTYQNREARVARLPIPRGIDARFGRVAASPLRSPLRGSVTG